MSGATRPMRISELLGKLPAWCRQAARDADKRSPAPADTSHDGPLDPASLPLPPALQGKVSAVREGDTLVLSAANSASAQILRFHGPRLASAAGVALWRVRVGAAGALPPKRKPTGPAPQLPRDAAPMLQGLADDCDHDRLSKALRRLAERANEQE